MACHRRWMSGAQFLIVVAMGQGGTSWWTSPHCLRGHSQGLPAGGGVGEAAGSDGPCSGRPQRVASDSRGSWAGRSGSCDHASMNRLADATSPYLLQHASNPVDWWPWGEEAMNEAKRRDVPILLSVGYASCHLCFY